MASDTAAGNSQALTSSASPVAGNGQAPASAQVEPQGSATQAPSSSSTADQQPSASNDRSLSVEDVKRMQQELAESRRESAKYRNELKTFQDAQLTAEQKRERDLADLQTKVRDYEQRQQRLALENAGYKLAASLGVSDMSAALALVQVEHAGKVTYDTTTGAPENLQELLLAVLKAHPALAVGSASQAPQAPQAPQLSPERAVAQSGGATNPGASARTSSVFTREMIARMSAAEYAANYRAIHEQIKRNNGRL